MASTYADISQVIEELKKDRTPLARLEDIKNRWDSLNFSLDEEALLKLLDKLVDDNVFRWLGFVTYRLPDVASAKGLLDLVAKIIRKVGADLAQGPFIRALIEIGFKNPERGRVLYEQMINSNDNQVILYAGLILGGSGKRDFYAALNEIQRGIKQANPFHRATCVKALRVIFEHENELREPDKVFEILGIASNEREDDVVKSEAAKAYIDFFNFNRNECSKRLISLAETGGSRIRLTIADYLSVRILSDSSLQMNLFEICARDEDENVVERVLFGLALVGKAHMNQSLEIIKKYAVERNFHTDSLSWTLSELGKVDLPKCLDVVESWLTQDMSVKLQFALPEILWGIGQSDLTQVVNRLEIWLTTGGPIKIVFKTIRKILYEIHESTPKNQSLSATNESVVNSCLQLVKRLGIAKQLDVERIARREEEKIFKCMAVLDELETERKNLDYDKIRNNLKLFKNLSSFISDSWLRKMEGENNKSHPLLCYLSEDLLDFDNFKKQKELAEAEQDWKKRTSQMFRIKDSLEYHAFLSHLNGSLGCIDINELGAGALRDGLHNEDSFWQTVSELDIISRLKNKYRVVVAPKLEAVNTTVTSKRPDLKTEIDGKELFIEVINPEMFKPLRYFRVACIPQRLRDKVYDEFKEHFMGMKLKGALVNIVVDIGRSEMDYESAKNYLEGSLQLKLVFEKPTGKIVTSYVERAKDSMYDLSNEMGIIISIVCYQRILGKDGRIHLKGRLFENPTVLDQARRETNNKLKRAIFG